MKGYLYTLLLLLALVVPGVLGFFMPNLGLAGPLRIMFFVMAGLWAILVLLLLLILNNLPAKVPIHQTHSSCLNPAIFNLEKDLQALGFNRCSEPIEIGMATAAVALPFVNRANDCFALLYHPVSMPDKIGVDFVSTLAGNQGNGGSLTTGNQVEGGILPLAEGSFMQLFPDMSPEVMYQNHREAVTLLAEHNLPSRRVEGRDFPGSIRKSIAKYRQVMLRNPIWHITIVLVRMISKNSPHVKPLRNQPAAMQRLDNYRRGASF